MPDTRVETSFAEQLAVHANWNLCWFLKNKKQSKNGHFASDRSTTTVSRQSWHLDNLLLSQLEDSWYFRCKRISDFLISPPFQWKKICAPHYLASGRSTLNTSRDTFSVHSHLRTCLVVFCSCDFYIPVNQLAPFLPYLFWCRKTWHIWVIWIEWVYVTREWTEWMCMCHTKKRIPFKWKEKKLWSSVKWPFVAFCMWFTST